MEHFEKALEIAIQNGYDAHGTWEDYQSMLQDFDFDEVFNPHIDVLDPIFWQSLGKGLSWSEHSGIFKEPGQFELAEWWSQMHSFVDWIAEGKGTIDGFFEKLLDNK